MKNQSLIDEYLTQEEQGVTIKSKAKPLIKSHLFDSSESSEDDYQRQEHQESHSSKSKHSERQELDDQSEKDFEASQIRKQSGNKHTKETKFDYSFDSSLSGEEEEEQKFPDVTIAPKQMPDNFSRKKLS